jgi:ABC-type lipoprotein export system ATPase subunit
MTDTNALLKLNGVTKSFDNPAGPQEVLRGVDLEVAAGESVAVVGPSGSGKSTLLNLIGALDQPTSGTITFNGTNTASLNDNELALFRNKSIGFVFQLHHLLPQCTALENVLVPTIVNPADNTVRDRAVHLLERVGLAAYLHARPGTLSGGERQRVAVVRALMNKPDLLLADEPTGSLSWEGAENLAHLLRELQKEEGMALVVVTHSLEIAQQMDRVLALKEGRLTPHGTVAAS